MIVCRIRSEYIHTFYIKDTVTQRIRYPWEGGSLRLSLEFLHILSQTFDPHWLRPRRWYSRRLVPPSSKLCFQSSKCNL